MKFRCEREVLAEALGAAGRATTGRSGSLPVLAGIRLELKGGRLSVTGSNIELTVQQELAVDGQVDGGTVLPARLATDIVKSLGEPRVEMTADAEAVEIAGGRSRFTIRPLAFDDYPRMGTPAGSAVTMPAADFVEALKQVVRAASTDDLKPQLTGVLLAAAETGLRLVATDSYRLAVRDLIGQTVLGVDQKVLVPYQALNEVIRIAGGAQELTLRLGERDASFEVGSTRVTTRLIEQEFPDYRKLMPAPQPNVLTVAKDSLIDAIRRVKLLAKDSIPVRLELGGDQLKISAITPELGTAIEEIDARYVGEPMTIAFNGEYLSSGIDACAGDEVTLSVQEARKQAVLRGVGRDDFFYLLMPMKV